MRVPILKRKDTRKINNKSLKSLYKPVCLLEIVFIKIIKNQIPNLLQGILLLKEYNIKIQMVRRITLNDSIK